MLRIINSAEAPDIEVILKQAEYVNDASADLVNVNLTGSFIQAEIEPSVESWDLLEAAWT